MVLNNKGKLRSNFLGTEFYIFDKGENPKKAPNKISSWRKELGIILYEANLMAPKGPRKI